MKSTKPTPQRLEIQGSLLARNTLLNLIGQSAGCSWTVVSTTDCGLLTVLIAGEYQEYYPKVYGVG